MNYPKYTVRERVADGCIHVLGVSIGFTGFLTLLILSAIYLPITSTTSLTIYGLAMLAMFSFSAAYHLVPMPDWKGLLRRFDQAAIFIKIAGTYTPFALIKMGGLWGYGLLIMVWTVALIGAFAKIFVKDRWDSISIYLYLGLGWVGVLFLYPLFMTLPLTSTILLIVGGGLYSIGVIFHLWEGLLYQNAVWHAFVLAGTSCHYAAIVSAVF